MKTEIRTIEVLGMDIPKQCYCFKLDKNVRLIQIFNCNYTYGIFTSKDYPVSMYFIVHVQHP